MKKFPTDLEDVSKFPLLFDSLYTSNHTRWSIENLEKLAGKNLIRVWNTVELVSTTYFTNNVVIVIYLTDGLRISS